MTLIIDDDSRWVVKACKIARMLADSLQDTVAVVVAAGLAVVAVLVVVVVECRIAGKHFDTNSGTMKVAVLACKSVGMSAGMQVGIAAVAAELPFAPCRFVAAPVGTDSNMPSDTVARVVVVVVEYIAADKFVDKPGAEVDTGWALESVDKSVVSQLVTFETGMLFGMYFGMRLHIAPVAVVARMIVDSFVGRLVDMRRLSAVLSVDRLAVE
jgi:hypothetical protein